MGIIWPGVSGYAVWWVRGTRFLILQVKVFHWIELEFTSSSESWAAQWARTLEQRAGLQHGQVLTERINREDNTQLKVPRSRTTKHPSRPLTVERCGLSRHLTQSRRGKGDGGCEGKCPSDRSKLLSLEGWSQLRQKERKEGESFKWRNGVSKGKKVRIEGKSPAMKWQMSVGS